MRTRLHVLTLLIVGLLAASLLAGCGGDDSGEGGGTAVSADTDAQAVLDAALGSDGDPIESGVLNLSFDLTSDRADGVSANAAITGPFQSNGDGALPSVDFDIQAGAGAGGPDVGFDGGVTLTPDGLYVNYGGSDYVIDDATFQLVKDSYAQSSDLQAEQADSGSLSQFGIDPSTWLTDVTNGGEQDLEGTTVVQVSGTADVAKIFEDLGTAAEQSGQASQLDAASLGQLQDSVQNASIDVFADADTGTLRQLDVNLEVVNPAGAGSADTVTVSIGIADPNTDQEISAPADAKPIADLLGQFPGAASSLGGLGAAAPSAPSASGGGGSDAYYQCVAEATTPAAVNECAPLLGG